MSESKENTATGWVDPDEAPDLSEGAFAEAMDAAPVRIGRPKAEKPKISTTMRLDPDVIDRLKAGGKGWQTRANAILRKGLGL